MEIRIADAIIKTESAGKALEGVREMSVIQEQAVQMIGLLPDDRVEILIEVMKGFMKPVGEKEEQTKRIGVAKGKFVVPDDIDECNDEIAEMFGVNG